jgi:hypothetical protein
VVGAEEVSLRMRIEAGTATNGEMTNRDAPSASHATGINSTTLNQNVYGKPGALFSVNRLSDAEAQIGLSCVCLIGRAMVWKSRTN